MPNKSVKLELKDPEPYIRIKAQTDIDGALHMVAVNSLTGTSFALGMFFEDDGTLVFHKNKDTRIVWNLREK